MKRMKKLLLVLCSAVFVTVSALDALPVYAANEITNAEGYHAPQEPCLLLYRSEIPP